MTRGKQIPLNERSDRHKIAYAEATIPVLEGDGATAVYHKKYAVRRAANGDAFEVFEIHHNVVAQGNFPTREDAEDWMNKNVAP